MKYNRLGQTDLQVSQICLGSMTWGEQNRAEQAFAQMDYAIEQGVNFFDTAELYAIPPKAETYGATETIIGRWLKQTGKRDKLILASKVCGPTDWCPHIRAGKAHLDRKNIIAACEASLRRLQTDPISTSTRPTGRIAPPTISANSVISTNASLMPRLLMKHWKLWPSWLNRARCLMSAYPMKRLGEPCSI